MSENISFFLLIICIVSLFLIAGCISPTKNVNEKTITLTPTVTAPPVPQTVVTVQRTPVPSPTTIFNKYTNSYLGFSMNYPSNWQVNELNPDVYWTRNYRTDVVEFYSPSFLRCNSEKTDCVYVRSEVKIEVVPDVDDLETFFVKDVARITSNNNVDITKKDSMFKLSGTKAYRLDYTSRSNEETINVLSAYTIQNDMGYIITYHAHAPVRSEKINQFTEYYNDVMTMFSSFKMNTENYKTI